MSSVESIGPCGVCAYTAQPGPPPNSSFQRPRLPNLSFLKSSKTRSGPDGSTTSFQSSICKTCQKICRDSSWISGTVSSIQRDGEIIPVPGGLERLRTSAEEGCHMCTLLYGFFSDEWLADIERRGATGADGDRVCLHIWEASATLISIKPCAGGLTYDKDKGQTDNTYSLSVSPVPNFDPTPQSEVFTNAQSATWTGSEESFSLFLHWMQECLNTHDPCNNRHKSNSDNSGFLPTRLIDVHKFDDSKNVRLHIVDSSMPSVVENKYLALSHCWGGQHFCLRTSNLDDFVHKIDYFALPKTYQDAIEIARRLRIRYLWIDSICIIQDSEADWQAESTVMGDVYQSAFCTIAATWASNSTQGCFFERDFRTYRSYPLAVGNLTVAKRRHIWPANTTLSYLRRRHNAQNFNDIVDNSPLAKRAWVFQERLFSRRMIHFGPDQLFWECCSHTASEHWPTMEERGGTDFFRPIDFLERSRAMSGWTPPQDLYDNMRIGLATLHVRWGFATGQYSTGELTFTRDKLVAISGVANYIQRHTKMKYLAGLWEPYLVSDLLWFAKKAHKSSRPLEYRAPSWSWAAIDGQITNLSMDANEETSTLKILNAETISAIDGSSGSAGQLKWGWIRVQGALKLAQIGTLSNKSNVDAKLTNQYGYADVSFYLLLYDEHCKLAGWIVPDTLKNLNKEPITCLRIIVQPVKGSGIELIHEPRVRGLALRPTGLQANEYRRVGYFDLEPEFCDPFKWFDGCEDQIITIV